MDIPIVGPASGSADAAARWITAHCSPSYTPFDVTAIVARYRELGASVEVDWFLALAQLAHETGNLTSWWSQRPRRNPAGIGVTGRTLPGEDDAPPGPAWAWDSAAQLWREGASFPNWHDHAIPAHLGRLLAYALPEGQGTPAQQAQIVRALAVRDLPAHIRGVAAAGWHGLNGRWAVPGTDYSACIARIAAAIRQS